MTAPAWTQRLNLPIFLTEKSTAGRIYIVTGANNGLGLEAARHLVSLGAAKVIMAVRNLKSGEAALADIEASTGKSGIAEVWHLDLASYDSVKAFASKAIQLERIDALIENAGIAISQDVVAEGHPVAVTVNVYSTFLLAFLLMPKMKEDARHLSTTPHITIVSSVLCFTEQKTWDLIKDEANPLVKMAELERDGKTHEVISYALTKLYEMQAVIHLASLLPASETGVVLNLVCPGLCKTGLASNTSAENQANVNMMNEAIGRTAEDGSRNLLYAATAGVDSHGKLTADCETKDDEFTPAWVRGDEAKEYRRRVWDIIAEQINAAAPGSVDKVLQS